MDLTDENVQYIGFLRSLYNFPALYSKYRKQIKFWYHFKEIIF